MSIRKISSQYFLLCIGIVSLCLFSPGRSIAESSSLTDFYIHQALDRYFVLPVDASTVAMSGSSGPSCRSSSCIYLNPAGLGEIQDPELSSTLGFSIISGEELLSEQQLEQSEYHGYLSAAFPLGPSVDGKPKYGTLDIAYSRYDGHTDDSVHTTPDGHRRSIAYGLSVFDQLNVGYAFHFYDDQLHNEVSDLHSHSRLLHIWGLQYQPLDELKLSGLFKLGIGQSDTEDFRFESNGLSHLRSYSGVLGVSGDIGEVVASAAFDYTRVQTRGDLGAGQVAIPAVIGGSEQGNLYSIRAGVEREFVGGVSIRGGAQWQEVESYKFERMDLAPLSGSVTGFGVSLGAGYAIRPRPDAKPTIILDYGFEYLLIGDGAFQHLVTVTIPFADDSAEGAS